MKRLLTVGFIVVYLGTLNFGILSHMLGFGTVSHPLMYFIVWDMFCGWVAYDSRAYVIGEGESQKLYDLSTPPWGEFHPWGYLGRQHYDALNNHSARIGFNTLRHTQHEPITRLFVIEENWAKKFNIPDKVWKTRYDEPKDIQKYHRLRGVLLSDGTVVQTHNSWIDYQSQKMLNDNPRLALQASRSRSTYLVKPAIPGRDMLVGPGPVSGSRTVTGTPVGAPLGN
jgi:hypothetical protein